jgi:methylmalonyl-CoA/ethylmalonyl-CoA epimerase
MSAPHIDHIGIIVADLDKGIEMMGRLMKNAPDYVKEMPEVGLRVAAFKAANVTIELLQYTSDEGGFAREVMGDATGLNHISAEVGDLDVALSELAEAGFKVQQGFPRQGAHGRVAFFEPDPVTGLLFEICQPDKDEGA